MKNCGCRKRIRSKPTRVKVNLLRSGSDDNDFASNRQKREQIRFEPTGVKPNPSKPMGVKAMSTVIDILLGLFDYFFDKKTRKKGSEPSNGFLSDPANGLTGRLSKKKGGTR